MRPSTKIARIDNRVIQLLVIVMALISITALREFVGYKFMGRMNYIVFPCAFLWVMYRKIKMPPEAVAYCVALTIGFFMMVFLGAEFDLYIHGMLFVRLAPIVILSLFIARESKSRAVTALALGFFIVECLLSFYERMNLVHLITYRDEDDAQATSALMLESDVFRSFGLMLHPLFNANTVSVAMGFVLCSNRMKLWLKLALLGLGLLGLWGFNSRGVFLVWAVILLYRFIFYNRKLWQMLIAIGIAYFLIPIILDWLLQSGLMGRFGDEFDFSDASTNTRLIAFQVFLDQRWNFQDILVGGRLITYYGSDITLENGILLDLGYWGIIVGSIKIVTEMLLTWRSCHNFPVRARVILMLATWGVAMMNNNSQQTWLMPMFVLFCVGLYQFQRREDDDAKAVAVASALKKPTYR